MPNFLNNNSNITLQNKNGTLLTLTAADKLHKFDLVFYIKCKTKGAYTSKLKFKITVLSSYDRLLLSSVPTFNEKIELLSNILTQKYYVTNLVGYVDIYGNGNTYYSLLSFNGNVSTTTFQISYKILHPTYLKISGDTNTIDTIDITGWDTYTKLLLDDEIFQFL